jgi:integrase
MPDPLTRYLKDCERRGLAKTTLWAKSHVLKKVDDEVGLLTATSDQLTAWLDRDLNMSSKSTYLATLRAFYEWCVDDGVLDSNPARKVSRMKVPKHDPKPIDAKELTHAIRMAEPLMKAWLLLGAASGLRCCEIAALKVEDVHHDNPPWLHVSAGKGAKERNVPLHPDVADALLACPQPEGGSGQMWPTQSAESVSRLINRFLRAHGSVSTAHKLRHYAATNYWKALNDAGTPDILLLTDFLGHSSPSVSMIYTRRDQAKGVAAMKYFVVGD